MAVQFKTIQLSSTVKVLLRWSKLKETRLSLLRHQLMNCGQKRAAIIHIFFCSAIFYLPPSENTYLVMGVTDQVIRVGIEWKTWTYEIHTHYDHLTFHLAPPAGWHLRFTLQYLIIEKMEWSRTTSRHSRFPRQCIPMTFSYLAPPFTYLFDILLISLSIKLFWFRHSWPPPEEF